MPLIILMPVGSHGDVHPFIAIGRVLKDRGHDVHLVSAEPFRELGERNGFPFHPTITIDEYERLMHHPDLWHPRKGLRVLFDRELLDKYLPKMYDVLQSLVVPGETVIVAGTVAISARVLNEVENVPLVTIQLQPMSCCSVVDPPVDASGRNFTWLPTPMIRTAYWLAEKLITDPLIRPSLDPFRKTLGLPPATRILMKWLPSPDCVLGTFPDGFANITDKGPAFHQVGFVPYDDAHARPTPPELLRFLEEPAVIFSFGSAMRMGRPYFEAAVQACETLGVRGVLLAKGGEQIPETLPQNVKQFDYAPFSEVFPKASVVVHHGGIGTSAQAVRAGVPQLVMPMAFDQADNAHRLKKSGVARVRFPNKFTGKNVARDLKAMLADTTLRERAKAMGKSFRDGSGLAADHIEQLVAIKR